MTVTVTKRIVLMFRPLTRRLRKISIHQNAVPFGVIAGLRTANTELMNILFRLKAWQTKKSDLLTIEVSYLILNFLKFMFRYFVD